MVKTPNYFPSVLDDHTPFHSVDIECRTTCAHNKHAFINSQDLVCMPACKLDGLILVVAWVFLVDLLNWPSTPFPWLCWAIPGNPKNFLHGIGLRAQVPSLNLGLRHNAFPRTPVDSRARSQPNRIMMYHTSRWANQSNLRPECDQTPFPHNMYPNIKVGSDISIIGISSPHASQLRVHRLIRVWLIRPSTVPPFIYVDLPQGVWLSSCAWVLNGYMSTSNT